MVELSQTALMAAILTPTVGMAVFNLMAVVRGWLIPRTTHEREIKILTDRIGEITNEKNEWRAAAQASEAVSREVRAQNSLLLEQGKTTAHALDGIRRGLVTAQRAEDVNP